MEECHRILIKSNLDILVANTQYKALMDACLKCKLLSTIMRNNIEDDQGEEIMKHKKLFEKVTRRGPDAYDKLVEILQKLDYTQAANILRPGEYSGTWSSIKQKKLEKQVSVKENIVAQDKIAIPIINPNTIKFDGCIISQPDGKDCKKTLNIYNGLITENPKYILKKLKNEDGIPSHLNENNNSKIPIYEMTSKNRGVFFCVNIINFEKKPDKVRDGAGIDGQSLLYLFKELGFTLFYYEDLTSLDFLELLDQLIDSDFIKNTDCFVMTLMSHGEMIDKKTDVVEFSDSSTIAVDDILHHFRNDKCLTRKPKVFIFPFCRGAKSDYSGKEVQTDSVGYSNMATYSDILICYASVPGYRTHRDPDTGSWYVQKLCEVFANRSYNTHLEDLLKVVGEAAAQIRTEDGKMQTASYSNYGFHKKLYFNPGYYKEK